MGFYYTPYWMALLGMRDLVHGPRPEQNYPTPIEPGNAIGMTVRTLLSDRPGSWFPVHGPRQDGPGTPGQVSCSGMEECFVIRRRYKLARPISSSFV